jgi:hypothetical protein
MKTRPDIPGTENDLAVSTAEQFQNETIRQVIKMQHDVFIFLLQLNFKEKKDTYFILSEEKKEAYIKGIFSNDNKLRANIVGVVLGSLNQEERTIYAEMRKEIDKRILQIVLERILTNQSDFILP